MKHPVDIIRAMLALIVQNTARKKVLLNNLISYRLKCAVKRFAVNTMFSEFRAVSDRHNTSLFGT